ncbi:hypothetical protein SteCoe_26928 [Stentor coeruleus]|uniref:G-protein coupled receptors family 2 profile 2 domain-containing protein n=1 Tax=Stentor coeruleus TaxID=5963 RepID=A0A1R2BBL9_9CILI|nr:hypothetical protein SteCoe_26928 [Stentor coeruleus]
MVEYYDGYVSSSVFSFISAVACCYALVLNYRRNKLSKSAQANLILVLTLFYLITNVSSLLPGILMEKNSSLCKAQAGITIFSALAGILWTGYIALYMYIKCYRENSNFHDGIWVPLIIVILFCVMSTAFPLGYDEVGFSDGSGWCWIKPNKPYHLYSFVYILYYIPVWIVIVWNMYAYIKIIRKVNEQFRTDEGRALSKSLIWYPFIAFVFYLPQSLSRFIESGLYNPKEDKPDDFINFKIFACCWIRLLGFANSVAYGITGHFQQRGGYASPKV